MRTDNDGSDVRTVVLLVDICYVEYYQYCNLSVVKSWPATLNFLSQMLSLVTCNTSSQITKAWISLHITYSYLRDVSIAKWSEIHYCEMPELMAPVAHYCSLWSVIIRIAHQKLGALHYVSSKPHHTTTVLWPFFRNHPDKPVPEKNFWTLWCKGRLTKADTPTNRPGATPSKLTSVLHHPPIFYRLDALPATQLTASQH